MEPWFAAKFCHDDLTHRSCHLVITKDYLGQNLLDHMPMDICQSAINTVMPHAETLVIDPELMKHRCIDIVDLRGVVPVQRFVAPLVAFAMGHSALDPSPGKPVGKHKRIVITTFLALSAWHASKLRRPVDDRILKKAALL